MFYEFGLTAIFFHRRSICDISILHAYFFFLITLFIYCGGKTFSNFGWNSFQVAQNKSKNRKRQKKLRNIKQRKKEFKRLKCQLTQETVQRFPRHLQWNCICFVPRILYRILLRNPITYCRLKSFEKPTRAKMVPLFKKNKSIPFHLDLNGSVKTERKKINSRVCIRLEPAFISLWPMREPLFMLLRTSYDRCELLGPVSIQNDAARLAFQYLTLFFLTIQLFLC